MFQLHPQLAKDTIPVTTLSLSTVLLANDARYPWLILVPEKPDLKELHDLSSDDYTRVTTEIRQTSLAMQSLFTADKMNVAALGNMVPQLHIHIIARYRDDPAWPGPIWGVGDAVPYEQGAAAARIAQIRTALSGL